MIRRWQVVAGLVVLMVGSFAPLAAGQSALDEMPEGPLRDQVVWFVDVLDSGGEGLDEGDISAHFSPDFLKSVPAREVLTTLEQLHPVLGHVTVGRIAEGTTDTDAGVQLIGDTGVTVRITLWVEPDTGLIGGLLIQPDTSGPATAAASPAASPIAATAPPPALADVLPTYETAEAEVLASGRAVVADIVAGEDAAVLDVLEPSVASAFGPTPASTSMQDLQTSRVHFEDPQLSLIFDGHFTPNGIIGFVYRAGPGYFQLEPETAQTGDVPTGRWNGQILSPGGNVNISVTFTGDAGSLAGTMDVPDLKIEGQELSNVRFRASEPLGDMLSERAVPLGGATGNNLYSAAYAWAGGTVTINAGFNPVDQVVSLQSAAYWPLPPDPAEGIATTPYQLPFAGTWLVVWGGVTELDNYHASSPNQRHAYDILIWKDGATYSGDGTANGQYYAWGQQVLAPANGTVVSVLNNQQDLLPNQIEDPELAKQIDPATHPAGNHVVIQTAENEFVFIAHMQQGSVQVQPGDDVRAGEVLGLVGNSGNTSEPHIHIHLQNTEDFFAPDAIGLPLLFAGYLADGQPSDLGVPVQGQFIAPNDQAEAERAGQ
jgi:hypothetical protein